MQSMKMRKKKNKKRKKKKKKKRERKMLKSYHFLSLSLCPKGAKANQGNCTTFLYNHAIRKNRPKGIS
jgi:hypothetical protein